MNRSVKALAPFLADTWWFGATNRLPIEEFKTALALRKKQGFSAIQIVAGVPPEVSFFSNEAKNAGGHPFSSDFKLNPSYFNELDKKIKLIVDAELTPIIYGGWGHHIDIIGIEKMKAFWKEIIARYSKFPVIFCLCGEADVFLEGYIPSKQGNAKFLAKITNSISPTLLQKLRVLKHKATIIDKNKRNKLLKKRIAKWNEVGIYLAKINTANRLLTVHISTLTDANSLFENPSWLDINSLQSGHDENRLYFMRKTILSGVKPIINLEPWYEGIHGNFDEYWQRKAFWICMLSGASGHVYGAHGVWQKENRDNFMGHWGKSNYFSSLGYKGADQVGKGMTFLSKMSLQKIVPDKKIISPQFSKDKLNYPICAKLQDKYLVYFPKKAERKFILNLSDKYKLTWINPEDLEVINVEKTVEKYTIDPDSHGAKDKLLLIELN